MSAPGLPNILLCVFILDLLIIFCLLFNSLEPDEPAEDDFSYDNVYIGTQDRPANESDELGFKRGDIIYILQKIDPNWWIGCLQNKVGLVPSNLLTEGFAH